MEIEKTFYKSGDQGSETESFTWEIVDHTELLSVGRFIGRDIAKAMGGPGLEKRKRVVAGRAVPFSVGGGESVDRVGRGRDRWKKMLTAIGEKTGIGGESGGVRRARGGGGEGGEGGYRDMESVGDEGLESWESRACSYANPRGEGKEGGGGVILVKQTEIYSAATKGEKWEKVWRATEELNVGNP